MIAASSSPRDHSKIWNAETGELMFDIPHLGRATFHPNGRTLATSSRTEIRVYDVSTWDVTKSWPLDLVNAMRSPPVAFDPGGRLLAAAVSPFCVRIFDSVSCEHVIDLQFPEESDIIWLAFSPGGTRLAITRSEHDVVIWNLGSLRRELGAMGLPAEKLPVSEHMIENDLTVKLDRGTELRPPGGWWSGFEFLARFEAIKLNYPDAIENMDAALRAARTDDHEVRAQLLMQRGGYHLANDSPEATIVDFKAAVAICPELPANKRHLAELLLFGPEDLRDDETAVSMLQYLVTLEAPKLKDRLNLILALIRLNRLAAARSLLEQTDGELVQTADPLSSLAYHCERSFFNHKANSSSEINGSDSDSASETAAKLASEIRESATLPQQVVIDEYMKLLH
jgi:WD40 repeat protein